MTVLSRLMAIGILLICLVNPVAAKRSFDTCWKACFKNSCQEASKYYKQANMWSKVQACQDNCKKNCKLFQKNDPSKSDTKSVDSMG